MELVKYTNDLVEAFNEKRIREYDVEIRNKATYVLIGELLNLLGVNDKDGTSKHHTEAFKFINQTMDRFSYSDIRLAFQKYVAGDFDLLVTQQLNAVVIGRVMRLYEESRNTELLKTSRNENPVVTDKEKQELIKQGLIGTWNMFIETGDLEAGHTWVYDKFVKQGLINLTKDEKIEIYIQAQANLISKKLEQRGVTDLGNFKKRLEEKDDPIKNEAKRIALVNFLRSVNEEEYKKLIS